MADDEKKKTMVKPEELARRYRVHHKTVRKWPKRGCPHHRAGRYLRFVDEEVDAWTLQQGMPQADTTTTTTEETTDAHH